MKEDVMGMEEPGLGLSLIKSSTDFFTLLEGVVGQTKQDVATNSSWGAEALS
jgi:hypothetical protein